MELEVEVTTIKLLDMEVEIVLLEICRQCRPLLNLWWVPKWELILRDIRVIKRILIRLLSLGSPDETLLLFIWEIIFILWSIFDFESFIWIEKWIIWLIWMLIIQNNCKGCSNAYPRYNPPFSPHFQPFAQSSLVLTSESIEVICCCFYSLFFLFILNLSLTFFDLMMGRINPSYRFQVRGINKFRSKLCSISTEDVSIFSCSGSLLFLSISISSLSWSPWSFGLT